VVTAAAVVVVMAAEEDMFALVSLGQGCVLEQECKEAYVAVEERHLRGSLCMQVITYHIADR
jgi:hypothetical protein